MKFLLIIPVALLVSVTVYANPESDLQNNDENPLYRCILEEHHSDDAGCCCEGTSEDCSEDCENCDIEEECIDCCCDECDDCNDSKTPDHDCTGCPDSSH